MRSLLCTTLVAVFATAALGDTLTFEFRGAIEEREGTLPDPFHDVAVGDPFSLSYTFDTDAPDEDPDDLELGCYATLSYELTAAGASQAGVSDVPHSIFLFVDTQRYATVFYDEGLTIAGILDFEPGTFLTDALPTTLDLSALTDALFDFGTTDGFARGRITTVIPEPATALMLMGALLAWRRR